MIYAESANDNSSEYRVAQDPGEYQVSLDV